MIQPTPIVEKKNIRVQAKSVLTVIYDETREGKANQSLKGKKQWTANAHNVERSSEPLRPQGTPFCSAFAVRCFGHPFQRRRRYHDIRFR